MVLLLIIFCRNLYFVRLLLRLALLHLIHMLSDLSYPAGIRYSLSWSSIHAVWGSSFELQRIPITILVRYIVRSHRILRCFWNPQTGHFWLLSHLLHWSTGINLLGSIVYIPDRKDPLQATDMSFSRCRGIRSGVHPDFSFQWWLVWSFSGCTDTSWPDWRSMRRCWCWLFLQSLSFFRITRWLSSWAVMQE